MTASSTLRPLALAFDLPDTVVGRFVRLFRVGTNEGAQLLTRRGNAFAIVILCPSHRFDSGEVALRAEIDKSPTAGVGILLDPDTLERRYLRRRFDRAEYEYCKPYDLFARDEIRGPATWLYVNDDGSSGRLLDLLSDKLEDVFFEIHSHFRDIDGLHADEALDELCKVLYVKLYDEEHTASNTPYTVQRRAYSSADECAADVRALYLEAAEYDSRVFELQTPGYSRARGVFSSPIKLSNAALAKSIEVLQCYHLGRTPFDVKGRAFQKVIGPAMRSGMGQYFTPDPVIRFLTSLLHPTVHELVADPFCGSAHFLTAALDLVRSNHGKEDKIFQEFAFGKLHGIEKSDRMVRVAMMDMRLHGDGRSNIRCADSLLPFTNYPDMKPASFDVVLTNPPFGSLLTHDAIRSLGQFELSDGRKTVSLEILGLERSIQLLRPGGRLGIVVPDGIVANRNMMYVRSWIARTAKLRAVISLPLETFVPFGAGIKTSILVMRKLEAGEIHTPDYPVFLAKSDGVGYDATGRPKDKCDLDSIAGAFARFIQQNGW